MSDIFLDALIDRINRYSDKLNLSKDIKDSTIELAKIKYKDLEKKRSPLKVAMALIYATMYLKGEMPVYEDIIKYFFISLTAFRSILNFCGYKEIKLYNIRNIKTHYMVDKVVYELKKKGFEVTIEKDKIKGKSVKYWNFKKDDIEITLDNINNYKFGINEKGSITIGFDINKLYDIIEEKEW